MSCFIELEAAVETHTGKVRDLNEDNYYFDGKWRSANEASNTGFEASKKGEDFLFAVCDGMGGQNSGEKASLEAVEYLESLHKIVDNNLSFNEKLHTLNKHITLLNNRIYSKGFDKEDRGMGTTLAGIFISSGKAYALHIGDSRVYMLRNGLLTQLTEDHTEAQRLVRMGVLEKSQARSHKSMYCLSRYLGMSPEDGEVEATISQCIDLSEGDIFLITSDGLTDMVNEERIRSLISNSADTKDCVKSLVEEALLEGGKDNITVIVIKINGLCR
ncbi:MAG: PP2C family protein-serine/threonine phosphatase [Bacillota bacterium]